MSFTQDFIEKTADALVKISVKRGASFDKDKAKSFMQKTMKEYVPKAQKTIQDDMKAASFGLNPKKPNRLMIEVGMVTFAHEAMLWADDVFEHSKTT
jgi:protein subunit release factor A